MRLGAPPRRSQAMSPRRKAMDLDDWLDFLADCKLLTTNEKSTRVGHELEAAHEATWIFCWSQELVSDEIRRTGQLQHMTYIGFLEGLCRLLCFVQLPTAEEMEAYGCASIEELYQKVDSKHLQPEVLRGALDKAPNWRVEEGSSASITEQLDTLLRFIILRMDQDGDRNIDEEELMRMRKERQQKRDKQAKAAMRAKQDYELHARARATVSATPGADDERPRARSLEQQPG